jgi:hypothetical protein
VRVKKLAFRQRSENDSERQELHPKDDLLFVFTDFLVKVSRSDDRCSSVIIERFAFKKNAFYPWRFFSFSKRFDLLIDKKSG